MTTGNAGSRPASSTDETIRQTVRALRSAHNVDALVLAGALGISRQSLYNRLNGSSQFLAAEIAELAQFFGCAVQDIYDGVVRVGGPPTSLDTGSGERLRHHSKRGVPAAATSCPPGGALSR